MQIVQALGLTLIFFIAAGVRAEPWMASRFSTNCAACHAPGRVNVPTKDRRCTLSCQGCHTNPNGGGLRNFYGKWTEQRWLRSEYINGYIFNKPQPAIAEAKPEPAPKGKVRKEKPQGLAKQVAKFVESEYVRTSAPHDNAMVNDRDQARMSIPEEDPLRERGKRQINAGLDFRYMYLDTEIGRAHKSGTMPMNTDLSISAEPVHNLTLVWESRFLRDPRPTGPLDEAYTTSSIIRSAYALVDDLPLNSYAMYGVYRPMFGNYDPDHTSLFTKMTGLDQRATYKTASIGLAPNVPYFNFNYIQPFTDRTMPQDHGFVVNAGLRFVTLGAFATLSYWHTSAKNYTLNTFANRQMSALNLGCTISRLTLTGEITHVTRETIGLRNDVGTVFSLEPRIRVWKENYLKTGWEYSNTAPSLKSGTANSLSAGFSSFLISSTELEFMYKDFRSTEEGVNTNEISVWTQLHLFF